MQPETVPLESRVKCPVSYIFGRSQAATRHAADCAQEFIAVKTDISQILLTQQTLLTHQGFQPARRTPRRLLPAASQRRRRQLRGTLPDRSAVELKRNPVG